MLEMFNKVLGTGIALKMYFGEKEKARSREGGQMFSNILRPRDIQV